MRNTVDKKRIFKYNLKCIDNTLKYKKFTHGEEREVNS